MPGHVINAQQTGQKDFFWPALANRALQATVVCTQTYILPYPTALIQNPALPGGQGLTDDIAMLGALQMPAIYKALLELLLIVTYMLSHQTKMDAPSQAQTVRPQHTEGLAWAAAAILQLVVQICCWRSYLLHKAKVVFTSFSITEHSTSQFQHPNQGQCLPVHLVKPPG